MAASANPFHDATVGSLLDVVAAQHPDGVALVLDEERVTFAEFRRRAETLARGLSALGLGPGDTLAIWLPNRPSWFITEQACARLGIVVVALNPRYRTHELAYILAQSDSAALLLTDHLGPVDYLETLHAVLPGLSRSAPGEIEAFLMSHPDVEQAFVVGVPDADTNEAPVAYVILRPDARLAEEELRAFCRGRIASYKIPRAVRFVADVPRTPGPHGDKVQKSKLRDQALTELGLGRA